MKKLSLILSMIAFSSFAYAQFNIDITSTAGGAFDKQYLQIGRLQLMHHHPIHLLIKIYSKHFSYGIGNVDIYKTGAANGSWNDSSNAHTFTINVVGTPTAHGANAYPRWRIIIL